MPVQWDRLLEILPQLHPKGNGDDAFFFLVVEDKYHRMGVPAVLVRRHNGVSQAARPLKTPPKKITAQRNCKGHLSFIISVPGGSSCSIFFALLNAILDIPWRFESIKIGVVFVEFCWTITKDLESRRDLVACWRERLHKNAFCLNCILNTS